MPIPWRKVFAEARAQISGDVATDIPAPPPGGAPRTRVRLFITPRAPAAASARGTLAQIVRDFSDRSEKGDPGALFAKYGGGLLPMAMGIPFMAVGVAILILLPRQAPRQILPYVFGAIFALAGLLVFWMGLSALKAAAAATQDRRKEPWRSDYARDPRGARPDAPGRSFMGCLGGLLFLLLIGVFNVLWTVRKDISALIVVTIVLVVFDALALLMLGTLLLAVLQRIRAGSPRLSWAKFPFFVGDRFEASFVCGRPLHVTGPVRATLRCVEQTLGEDSSGRPEVHPYAIYARSETFEPPQARLTAFDVRFDVPGTVPGTDLSKQESTYWLLEVRAPLEGPDFSTQFLVPIYSRASSTAAAPAG